MCAKSFSANLGGFNVLVALVVSHGRRPRPVKQRSEVRGFVEEICASTSSRVWTCNMTNGSIAHSVPYDTNKYKSYIKQCKAIQYYNLRSFVFQMHLDLLAHRSCRHRRGRRHHGHPHAGHTAQDIEEKAFSQICSIYALCFFFKKSKKACFFAFAV